MQMTATSAAARFLKARWVLPMTGEPIEYGAVEIEGERIKRVLTAEELAPISGRAPAQVITDYGEAIIVPGFINLHTHIEYSILHLLETDAPLFDWIPKLMGHVKTWPPATFVESATHGAMDMLRHGTTCIVDSSFSGIAAVGAARAGLRAVVALELFGIVETETESLWKNWLDRKEQLLKRFHDDEHDGFGDAADAIDRGLILLSVAPHAPYTVGPSLARKAREWADANRVVWTMHVAESPHERRWIESTDPPLDRFLEKVHMLPGGKVENIEWRSCGKSPVQHLADHDLLEESLIAAHVVQVDDKDIKTLAAKKLSVAHCPRSNARLRTGAAPIGKFLDAGVNVGFGTDSAASTDDLNVLAEARFAWNLHRAIEPSFPHSSREAIYRLTAGAAKSLGLSDSIGTLAPGKFADIAIFNISSASRVSRDRPYDVLLYGNLPLSDVFVSGKQLLQNALY